ncbi:cAMP-binding domain of CRP or a regulatory subunit of cAMP-dependent protein kinases [Belnapia rosea]|nr:cAMP-binding domain of CRP or a regulatory subunit of cAMP-dependent protein kinases [Belnapia rosea]
MSAGLEAWHGLVISARMRVRRLEAGEALFRQGEVVTALYRLQGGRIRLIRCLEDGTAVVLHVARAGETLAEASAFADAYHCDAVADVPSEVECLPKAELVAALASDGEARLGFTRLLAAQVRDLRARAELQSIRSAPERVLAWLRMRATDNPPVAVLERTWTEVAAEIGLTREATYRALAKLEVDGRIVRQGSRVSLQAM